MERLGGPRRALVAVSAGTFLVTFDGAAVQMALPALRHDLGAPLSQLHWVMTAFLLVSTAALLPAGRAGDLYGRARVWRAGVALFVVASAAAALMPGLWGLVVARAAQGLGAALVTGNAAALLASAYPSARGLALGIGNVAIAGGLVAGPPVGALLTASVSWRLLFPPAVVLGLVALWGARGALPQSERRRGGLDLRGAMLSAPGLGALIVGGAEGRGWGWASPPVELLLGGGAALLGGFAWHERRARFPLVERALFASRTFRSCAMAVPPAFAALFTVTVAMPFFLVEAQHRGLVHAGLMVGMVPLGLSLSAPLSGALSDRMGSRLPCVIGLVTVAAALGLMVVFGAAAPTWMVLLSMGLTGAGLGGFEAPNSSAGLGTLDHARLGVGTATLAVLRNLGMTLGTAAAATLLATRIDRVAGPEGAVAGVRLALAVGAALALVGAAMVGLRPAGPPRRGRT